METQAKHTPTPWKMSETAPASGNYEIHTEEDTIAYISGMTAPNSKENAEFIVNACNSHEKFIELAHMVAGKMYDDGVGRGAVQLAEELLDGMGIQRWNGPNLQNT